jgi:uncharacterized protein
VNLFEINIIGLSNKVHTFDFELDAGFFEQYGKEILEGGLFQARVLLNKHETFIEASFEIKGTARLLCDRSLEPFDQPVSLVKKVVFKYGETASEESDEIIIIPRDQTSLELGQLMYEFICLEIPIKRLHPRFAEESDDDETEGSVVYRSDAEDESESESIDPRWSQLLKLKKNEN